ncbi:MFS general substrate transporter [Penicillium frequentans]|uniref:MFS general substrate transporter n=1 Tax=Penicillium frequentans TaxID=3151616 RepID=A0AAD6GFY1_9EURO|nr:MFS general substrate transporter [Penicillium glabrum]
MAGIHCNSLAEEVVAEKGIDLSRVKPGIIVGDVLNIHVSEDEDKKVLMKIDLHILPLMGVCYMLQFMDKVTLGYSTNLGLIKDLGLHGSQYSWANSIFFFGYLGMEFAFSYLAVRFPLGKYLATTVVIWGVILACHAATQNFTGLIIARFFLGVMEAAVAPGFSLITGMFYKRSEQPSRMAFWFAGNGAANILSGLVAYGIGNISSPVATWRVLFLILGCVTAAYGVVLLVFLPDSVSKARFLTIEEKDIVLHRTLENKTGFMDDGHFKIPQMLEAFRDPQAWLLFAYQVAVNIPTGGISSFTSIIIDGFGFSMLDSLLLQMPFGVVQLMALAIGACATRYFNNIRVTLMIAMVTVSFIGIILVNFLPSSNSYGRLVGIWMTAAFSANIPMSLSLITSNVGSMTKRSTVSSMLFIAYCTGNIIGPQFFYSSEAPKYPTGLRATLSGLALGVFFLISLLGYYLWENTRRNHTYGFQTEAPEAENIADDFSNLTDMQIKSFRYAI